MDLELLVNTLAIKSGGGLQKTLSFLNSLDSNRQLGKNVRLFCTARSEVSRRAEELQLNTTTIGSGLFARVAWEMHRLSKISPDAVVFNIGGLTPIRATQSFVNVNECAYSNLFYPEIDFWCNQNLFRKLKSRLIDRIRMSGVGNGDFWVFQTPSILERAVKLFGFPEKRCRVVLPSPSKAVSVDAIKPKLSATYKELFNGRTAFLFLGGTNENKRLHNLPRIAKEMLKMGGKRFVFVLTMQENDTYYKAIQEVVETNKLDAFFENVGIVPPADVASLISSIDVVCNFSRLESFSNNFVEAWNMKKPLIATDADWSHSVAADAALYVNPDDFAGTASTLIGLTSDEELKNHLTNLGELQLTKFPTPEAKLKDYFDCFESALRLGKIGELERPKWATK